METLEGIVLTHRVEPEERDAGELWADPDLGILAELGNDEDERIPLAGGGYLEDQHVALVGPEGWVPAGDQVALRVVRADADEAHAGRLVVSVETLGELPAPDPAHADLLEDVFHDLADAGEGAALDTIVLLLAARERDPAFLATPSAPIADILDLAGLYDEDGWTYRLGEGPDAWDPDAADAADAGDAGDDLVAHLELDHGFDAATVRDVLLVSAATLRLANETMRAVLLGSGDADRPELDEETADALGRLIATPDPSFALLHDVVGADAITAASLLALIDSVDADLDRRGRANRHWLRAQLLEFVAEDHADAEAELRRAVEMDPHHGAAAFALAAYRSDRGDARGALELIRNFELHDEDREWVALLERYARPRQASAGRNDPCPCGSGKKYKRCCADRVGWSLEERRDWLMDKVMRFATSPANLDEAAVLAEAAYLAGDVSDILEDDFLTTLMMFDAGTITDFAEVRGSLLPADEREFLTGWGRTRVSAYEVVEVDADAGKLALLDHRDGEGLEVADRTMSSTVSAGDLVLGWFAEAPSGRVEPLHGGILVPPDARTSAIALISEDPDAGDVAEWYGQLLAPPTLVDKAGDPLEFIGSTFEVGDVATATQALRAAFDDEGEDGEEEGATVFHLLADEDEEGVRSSLGSVTLHTDGRLVTFAMTEPKSLQLRGIVETAVPDARFVETKRRPAADVLRAVREGRLEEWPPEDDRDPDEQRQLDELGASYMRDYEERWVDMEVPALGGLTPRQAVDDPTRRDDLERLLRDFEGRGGRSGRPSRGATMDIARVRSLLGL